MTYKVNARFNKNTKPITTYVNLPAVLQKSCGYVLKCGIAICNDFVVSSHYLSFVLDAALVFEFDFWALIVYATPSAREREYRPQVRSPL